MSDSEISDVYFPEPYDVSRGDDVLKETQRELERKVVILTKEIEILKKLLKEKKK